MLDILVISLYLVAFIAARNKLLIAAFIPLCIAVSIPIMNEQTITFSIVAVLYSLSAMAVCFKSLPMALGLFSMSIYFIIFAIDTWVNADVKTWLYNHHEIIVSVLHIIIITSSSSRAIQIISSSFDNFINYCDRYKRGDVDNKNTCSRYSKREN